MDSDDKAIVSVIGLVALMFISLFVCVTVHNIHESDNQLKEFEAAAKAGLVQRIDPSTTRTIWVRPTE